MPEHSDILFFVTGGPMSSILLSMQGAISQGVLWGIMVLGVYITYKVLNISDLTVDGSFALGSCVCATMVVNFKMSPVLKEKINKPL